MTKPFSKAVSNVFKVIYLEIENFHRKSKFLSNYNKFWLLQNVDPIIEKSIATYNFSTLHPTLSHDKLTRRLCNVIDFISEGGNRTHICISKNNVVYWGKKSKDNVAFTKSTLKIPLKNLI